MAYFAFDLLQDFFFLDEQLQSPHVVICSRSALFYLRIGSKLEIVVHEIVVLTEFREVKGDGLIKDVKREISVVDPRAVNKLDVRNSHIRVLFWEGRLQDEAFFSDLEASQVLVRS